MRNEQGFYRALALLFLVYSHVIGWAAPRGPVTDVLPIASTVIYIIARIAIAKLVPR
jgi:hypothetical protein